MRYNNLVKCQCENVPIGSLLNQVYLNFPDHMKQYEKRRVDLMGIKPGVSIDRCIVEEIKYLWSLGITTYGCCCGHNHVQSMVNVDDKDIEKMLQLGYVQNHTDPERKDTFRLKSAG